MVLTKHRIYSDGVATNLSSITGPSTAPHFLGHHIAPTAANDTLLRARAQFSMSVQVGSAAPPPEIWWPVTQVLLYAYWNTSGSDTLGASFGTSEHYLGTKLFRPTLTPSVTAPTTEYVVTYSSDEDLVLQTSRQGNTANNPRLLLGCTIYDPYTAIDGTYASIAINWQFHMWSLWASHP